MQIKRVTVFFVNFFLFLCFSLLAFSQDAVVEYKPNPVLGNACINGIIAADSDSIVIVNGESLREGESLDGITVVEVDAGGVILEFKGEQFYNALGEGCSGVIPEVYKEEITSGIDSFVGQLKDQIKTDAVAEGVDPEGLNNVLLGLGGVAMAMLCLLSLAVYMYTAFCLQTIAKKTKTPNGWFAWIPVLNLFLMCSMARRSFWWMLLFFIPLVNIVALFMLWMGIAQTCRKPGWLAILMFVPVANMIVLGYLAFSKDVKVLDEEEVSSQEAQDIDKGPPLYRP